MPKRKIPLEELGVDGNDQDYEVADEEYVDEQQKLRTKRQQRTHERHSTETDLDYEDANTNTNNRDNGVLGLDPEGEKVHDVNYIVKLILTKDARGQNFQKQHINQYLTNKRFKSDSLLDDAIAILENVYGLTLVDAPTAKQEKKFNASHGDQRNVIDTLNANGGVNGGNGDKITKKTPPRNRFFLVSNLLQPAQQVLGDLWMTTVNSSLDKTKIGDTRFFLPKFKQSILPKLNSDLVKTGIMMLVTTLVILSENHIMESQLIRSLRKFGISDNNAMKNSNINMNWEDVLKELVSREYLTKLQLADSEKDKIYAISLGRRSLAELEPTGVYEYIKTLYGSDFNEVIADRTRVTIERAYKVDLKEEAKQAEAQRLAEAQGHAEAQGLAETQGHAEISNGQGLETTQIM